MFVLLIVKSEATHTPQQWADSTAQIMRHRVLHRLGTTNYFVALAIVFCLCPVGLTSQAKLLACRLG